MCGRFTLKTPVFDWLMDLFPERFGPDRLQQLARISPLTEHPRYNIAPTQQIMVLHQDDSSGLFRLDGMRWGLVPGWADDLAIGARMINARSETVAEKPSFRPSLADKRCVVLADGYYEWQKITPKEKQPHWIHRPNEQLFAMAGLWAENRRFRSDQSDAPLKSATIITTPSNQDTRLVHDRMPAILTNATSIQQWLTLDWKEEENQQKILSLLEPAPTGTFQLRRVSNAVGKPQNDSEFLIESLSD